MLRISLRDGEKVIVNGAVLRSSGRTALYVENHVAILRGREVMAPEEATTPARRLYFACMMAYIDPDSGVAQYDRIVVLLRELLSAIEAPEAKVICAQFAHRIACGDFYRALSDCRALIDHESAILARLQPEAA